jgi:hypothetical protein
MSWRERCDRLNQSVVRNFGQTVSYIPISTQAPVDVFLHFESVSRRVDPAGRPVDAEAPTAYVRIADLPAGEPVPGDMIEAQGVKYSLESGEPDGYGAMRLWLREVT